MTAEIQKGWHQIALLSLVGAGLRLASLGRESLWLDEAISYLAARLSLSQIAANVVQSSHPPFYYSLLHFWLQVMPDSDTAVKLLSVLWGLLVVPTVFLLCQQLFARRSVSLTAAAMTAISPFQILYSQELRMYTLLMFLVLAGTAVYWQGRKKGHIGWWIGFGLLFLLAVYSHLFAFLALAGIGLHALLEFRQNRRAFWFTFAAAMLITLLFIPWLSLMLGEAQPALGSLRPLQQPTTFNPLKPLSAPVFLLFGMSGSFWFSGLILFTFFAYLAIFLLEMRKGGWQQIPSGLILITLIMGTVLGLPLLVYAIRPFFLPERTLAAAAPFLIIFVSWGITRRHSPLPFLTGLALLLMLIGTFTYHTGDLVKPPYRAATNYFAQRALPGDAALHTSDGSYLPGLRYAPQLNQALLAGDPDPRKPTAVYEALGGQVWTLADLEQMKFSRLWLVVALEHSESWQLDQARAIENQLSLVEKNEVGGIQIILYQAKSEANGD